MSPTPYPVTIHPFTSPTGQQCAFERGPSSSRNALIFIGGLTSGPQTTDLDFLANMLLQNPSLGYSLWEFRMRSSFAGFGFSSLFNDAEDTAALVAYLRGLGKERIILMGASTGCQDSLEYAKRTKNQGAPSVDGYILQNPVSDREAASLFMSPEDLEPSIRAAKEMIEQGDKDEVISTKLIPPIFTTPVTAYRWYSLAAKGGDDDYFSSDVSDEKVEEIFERVDKPIMILPGAEDEMVPPFVDREALLQRWISACNPGVASELSGFIPGADHVLSQKPAQEWVAGRVKGFLGGLATTSN